MASKIGQGYAEGRLRSVISSDGWAAPGARGGGHLKRSDHSGRMQVGRRAFMTDHREIYQSENGDR